MRALRSTQRAHFTMLAAAAPAPIAVLILVPTVTATAAPRSAVPKLGIVLVHGARADGSSRHVGVRRLPARGYQVLFPPNPWRRPVSGGDADGLDEIQSAGL
jgi:hypothetical protein